MKGNKYLKPKYNGILFGVFIFCRPPKKLHFKEKHTHIHYHFHSPFVLLFIYHSLVFLICFQVTPTVTVLPYHLLLLLLNSFQYYCACLPLIYLSPRCLLKFKFGQAIPQLSVSTDLMQN